MRRLFFRLLARFHRTAHGMEIAALNLPPPDTIPVTAIYTREDGIVACDAEGVLTVFNHAARELHGRPVSPISADDWA